MDDAIDWKTLLNRRCAFRLYRFGVPRKGKKQVLKFYFVSLYTIYQKGKNVSVSVTLTKFCYVLFVEFGNATRK